MATFDTSIGLGFNTNLTPKAHKRSILMKDHSFIIHKDSSDITYEGTIGCIHLSAADRTTIQTFYDTNEDLSWQFENPHDGETYTLYFKDTPFFTREKREATVLYTCIMSVIGTKN